MRLFVHRYLDDERIRGRGDNGQREGGLTPAQECAYVRLFMSQFREPNGYLPNRRAFLCDAAAIPTEQFEEVIRPVLERFFKLRGDLWSNVRARSEWEHAHSRSLHAKVSADARWRVEKTRLSEPQPEPPKEGGSDAFAYAPASCSSPSEQNGFNVSLRLKQEIDPPSNPAPDQENDAVADAHAHAPAACERERDNNRRPSAGSSPRPAGSRKKRPRAPLIPGVTLQTKGPVWNQEACEDWTDRFGGSAPGARITKALRPLSEKYTWEVVRPAWQRFLAETEAKWAYPEKFAQTFGDWAGFTGAKPKPDNAGFRAFLDKRKGGVDDGA